MDPIAPLILSLALILVAAKVGGHWRAGSDSRPCSASWWPASLLGNLTLIGFYGLDYLKTDAAIDMLSRLGVIILLFQVGLESTVAQMMKVGLVVVRGRDARRRRPVRRSAGASAPGCCRRRASYAHVFLGATLTATSVGITARVLKDLGRSHTDEARIILGAAVIDDVLGLVILAVVTGIIAAANQGDALSYAAIGGVIAQGDAASSSARSCSASTLSPRLFSLASKLEASGVLLADRAGVLLPARVARRAASAWRRSSAPSRPASSSRTCTTATSPSRGEHSLEELIEPIASFLVPIFFVADGHAHRSRGVHAAWRARPRGRADRRSDRRQADLLAGRDSAEGSTACRSASA